MFQRLTKLFKNPIKMKTEIKKVEKFEVDSRVFDSEAAALKYIAEKNSNESVIDQNFAKVNESKYNYVPIWDECLGSVDLIYANDDYQYLLSNNHLRYTFNPIEVISPTTFLRRLSENEYTIQAANFSRAIEGLAEMTKEAGGSWPWLVERISEFEIAPECIFVD